jgi:hypothetical protein
MPWLFSLLSFPLFCIAFITDVSGRPWFYKLPGRELPKNPPDVNALKTAQDRAYSIGWWHVSAAE